MIRAPLGVALRTALGPCAVAMLVLVLAACEDTEPPKAPPKLAFAETSYDFGRVAQGTAVEHTFAFANAGGTDLSILNMRAACDTQAKLVGGNELAPRAAGSVQARFDTGAVYGPQRRTVTVYSNDPTQRAVMLTMSGEVVLDVVADPAQVYLGVVPPGAASLRDVALRTGSDAVHLGAPESDASQLALQLAEATDGIPGAILSIGTATAAPPGPFSAVVRVPTTSPQHPVLRIAVTGIISDAPAARVFDALSQPGAGNAAPTPVAAGGR